MNKEDVKTCAFHKDMSEMVKFNNTMFHKLDKKVDRFTWMSGFQLILVIGILVELFILITKGT